MKAFRVLLVDDDPDLSELFCEVLSSAGFSVTTCSSLPEALAHIERGVDAVITDVTLGGEPSGLSLCEHVKSRQPNLPIFVLSGDRAIERIARRLGADGFWLKPVDLGVVARSLRQHSQPSPPMR